MLREGGPTRKSWWKGITAMGLLFILSNNISAQTLQLNDLPLNSVIQIGSYDYVKIAENKYMQSTEVTCPDGATVGGKYVKCFEDEQNYTDKCLKIVTMQTFTAEICASYATPTGTSYIEIGYLRDERDSKFYEVRKFSDGVCWMVTNLKYGGTIDACASRTSFSGNGGASVSNRFGTGTYGDCRNAGTYDGYLYNWQAAMQDATAYYNNNYTGSGKNIQGLCPAGWVLPTSNSITEKGSFGYLHVRAGSPSTGFWQPSGNWKSTYDGICNESGTLSNQGSYAYYWSSTQYTNPGAYQLKIYTTKVAPSYNGSDGHVNKNYGRSIRCLHF